MGSVYDERGNLRASLNSSVRFSASTPYTSALIDWGIAEDLLKLSHQAPLFAAWYYSYDDLVYLFRLDEHGCINSKAQVVIKHTPRTYFDKTSVAKKVVECPFRSCYSYRYQDGVLTHLSNPLI
ncbi:hypothetical protein H6F52_02655 [Coleofasciculus sp. FACHB-542]|nr:hypothetical protein [Coleofasciculus sp. FACHB-542]